MEEGWTHDLVTFGSSHGRSMVDVSYYTVRYARRASSNPYHLTVADRLLRAGGRSRVHSRDICMCVRSIPLARIAAGGLEGRMMEGGIKLRRGKIKEKYIKTSRRDKGMTG